VFGKRALLLALVVEISSQGKKANKHNELKDKSCFQKSFAHRLLAPGIFDVRPIANSVPVEVSTMVAMPSMVVSMRPG